MGRNCLIGQSGGPTVVINSSLLGLIRGAEYSAAIDKIYGAEYGIEGVLNDRIVDFTLEEQAELELFKYTPASILGSCRYKLPNLEEEVGDYQKIFATFAKYKIGFFFYIGGNDSMDTVMKLNKYAQQIGYEINIIGIPKTIDNDLLGTDHCPGYGSAAKYIATSVMEIARDGIVYDREIVQIIEVMGRDTGWLAAASILAKEDSVASPDLIYLPEIPFNKLAFLREVKEKLAEKKKINIVVAEGLKDSQGRYLVDSGADYHDEFGHRKMGGVAYLLGEWIKGSLCNRVKSIEINIMQRAAFHAVAGNDLEEAFRVGFEAVKFALAGETGKMVAIKRISNHPYKIKYEVIAVEKVANKTKKIPFEWINQDMKTVNPEFYDYINPLIQGEVEIPNKRGLPRFAKLYIKN